MSKQNERGSARSFLSSSLIRSTVRRLSKIFPQEQRGKVSVSLSAESYIASGAVNKLTSAVEGLSSE